jgi:hypothetical protein
VDGQIGRGRHIAVAEGLEDDRGVAALEARAADVFLHIDAREAQLGGLAQHVDREVPLLVPLGRMRGKLSLGEGLGRILNGDLIVAEREIHARYPPMRGRANPVGFLAADLPRGGDCVNHIPLADFECCSAEKNGNQTPGALDP